MAVRITKVYTRTGDRGETGLVGGKRVAKDSPRVEAYGAVDELNSIVGLARAFNEEHLDAGEAHRFLDGVLRQIQDELFDFGSELATPPEFFQEGMYRVGKDEIQRLEKLIDRNEWLSFGRKRPIPHESWFQVAGYFFYYGHYYAALCIEHLGPEKAGRFQPRIAAIITHLQEKDGSWFDFPFYNYHQQYGAAFALMTLAKCRPTTK